MAIFNSYVELPEGIFLTTSQDSVRMFALHVEYHRIDLR
jgi:hypothetical protein